MKRRDFIMLLGGAAAAWPLVAHTQQRIMPVIGFLSTGSPGERASLTAAFNRGLKETGYVERENVAIEYRWAEGQYDRLSELAADLVRRQVAVIVATGGPGAARAAKAVTATIPIVFTGGGDPVGQGLVASLNRPGGNVTGVSNVASEPSTKRLDLLRAMVPKAAAIGMLVNPNFPDTEIQLRQVREAALGSGLQFHMEAAGAEDGIDAAFAAFIERRIDALLVATDPLFVSRRDKIVMLAARYKIPTIYPFREYAVVGGLMSYGTNLAEGYREAGVYTGRILKGAKPSDLPVIQLSRFELVINLKTVKANGLEVPPNLLAITDELLE